ncbi:MAG: methionine biosynthesis protein MetW [Thermoleophilia bacterium]
MRPDLGVVAGMVQQGSRVLDLGCGDGALLEELIMRRGCSGQGVEVSTEAFDRCVSRGIPVMAANIDEGLPDFADDSFDVVVLSQTLQTTHRPALVLQEMMRVAATGIVSFPNFGHVRLRLELLVRGRMPASRLLPSSWFDTPNIHLCTIRDFEALAGGLGLHIVDRVLLDASGRRAGGWTSRRPNLLAAAAAYTLRRD